MKMYPINRRVAGLMVPQIDCKTRQDGCRNTGSLALLAMLEERGMYLRRWQWTSSIHKRRGQGGEAYVAYRPVSLAASPSVMTASQEHQHAGVKSAYWIDQEAPLQSDATKAGDLQEPSSAASN